MMGPASRVKCNGWSPRAGIFLLLACVCLWQGRASATLLEPMQAVFDPSLASAKAVTTSPDGKHVYVGGGTDLTAYARNAATGALTILANYTDGVSGLDGLSDIRGVTVSPDGKHLYVASTGDSAVSVFDRNATTGLLTFVEVLKDGVNGVDALWWAASVVVSPDGAHVYVAAFGDNAVSLFTRNATTGQLTYVEALRDGVNGVDGLSWAMAVTISLDGASVYVAANSDNAVSVFDRNATTGQLTFVEALFDGTNGGDGLSGANAVVVSPDDAHVYVAALYDNAVTVFFRGSPAKQLTFVETLFNAVNGVDGLAGAISLAVSPDGANVYVAAFSGDAVSAFERNAITGQLTYVESHADGLNGVDGLDGPYSVAVSPDGVHIYVAATNDAAVSAFEKGVLVSLGGRLTDAATGDALTCAAIELTHASSGLVHNAVADQNGEYFFPELPEGIYDIRILAPGYGEINRDPVTVLAGQINTQNFALAAQNPRAGARGTITDADNGDPLVGVLVRARVNGIIVATTYTCASGAFELTGLVAKATSVTLEFELDNYASAQETVEVTPDAMTQANQTMEKAGVFLSSLTGTVRWVNENDDEVPLAGAQVTVRGPANASVDSDVYGAYAFPAIPAGTYTIRVSKQGYAGATGARTLGDGQVAAKDFMLDAQTTPADVNGDTAVNALDIQFTINAALGIATGLDTDINDDGPTNALDIQLVINAALGIGV